MNDLFTSIYEVFWNNPFGQIIGFLAFGVSIINFAFAKDKMFIFLTLIASIFWGVHFYMIGAFTAAYINFFDVFKNAVALKFEKNKKWMYFFIFSYIFIGIYTFFDISIKDFSLGNINYLSIFPTFCSLLSTYLVFYTRGIKMKIGFIFVVFSWLVYNITFGSIGGVMTDLSLFFAGIFGIFKDLKNEKSTK